MFARNQAFVVKPWYSPEFFFRGQLLDGMHAGYLSTKLSSDKYYFACLGHLTVPLMLIDKHHWGYHGNRPWDVLRSFPWDYSNQNVGTLRLALETQSLNHNAHGSGDLRDPAIRSPWAWLLYKMALTGSPLNMSDKEFWELIDYDIISLMLRRGANCKVAIRSQGARTSGLGLYMYRGWRSPPTESHKEKYLQDLRDFLVGGAAFTQIFNCHITDYLVSLVGKSPSEFLPNDWSAMTESIEVVLNHMAEKEGCDISFEKRLVDGLLSVANTSFPREVYPGLESSFSSILDRIATKRKCRTAAAVLGAQARRRLTSPG